MTSSAQNPEISASGPASGPASNESGQSMVEFILTLMLAVSMVALMSIGFKNSLQKFWVGLTQEVAAPCPKCKFDPKSG